MLISTSRRFRGRGDCGPAGEILVPLNRHRSVHAGGYCDPRESWLWSSDCRWEPSGWGGGCGCRTCLLVMIGVRLDGVEELIALAEGFRESAGSWADLLPETGRWGSGVWSARC